LKVDMWEDVRWVSTGTKSKINFIKLLEPNLKTPLLCIHNTHEFSIRAMGRWNICILG